MRYGSSRAGWIYYCEDLLRLSGMLLTVVGVYKIIERINLLYVDARSRNH